MDDRGVVWPVTIDPTFTLQQKLVAWDESATKTFRLVGGNQRRHGRGRHARVTPSARRSRLGLCLCAQRWHLDRAAELSAVGRGGR